MGFSAETFLLAKQKLFNGRENKEIFFPQFTRWLKKIVKKLLDLFINHKIHKKNKMKYIIECFFYLKK
jgi:hypothetical protein